MDDTVGKIDTPFNTNVIKGGFATYFGLGSLNTFGNICIYVINYIRMFGNNPTLAYRQCIIIYSVMVIVQSLSSVYGCQLEEKIGPRDTTFVGTALMVVGYLLSYFSVSNIFLFTATYAIICGVGSGICYPVPMSVAIKCNKKKEGYSCGYIHLGGGLSAIFFTPLQLMWLNPTLRDVRLDDNFDRPESNIQDVELLSRLPFLFVIHAVLTFFVQYYGANKIGRAAYEHNLWDKESVFDKYVKPVNNFFSTVFRIAPPKKLVTKEEATSLLEKDNHNKLTTKDLLNNSKFYKIYISMLLSWQSVIVAHSYWKILGMGKYGMNDGSVSNIAFSCAIASLIGRVFWGIISDKYGWRLSWCSIILMVVVLCLTFKERLLFNIFAYGSWVTMVYFAHSGCYTLSPLATNDIFGSKNFAPAFGLLSTTRALAGVLTALMTFSIGNLYSFDMMPLITALLSIASLLVFKTI